MKSIITTIIFASMATAGFAQSFQKGQIDINAGVGLVRRFVDLPDSIGTQRTIIPAIMVSAEKAISNRFSVGVSAGVKSVHSDITSLGIRDTFDHTALYIGPRGSWHFVKSGRIDAYTGIAVFYAALFTKRSDATWFQNMISPSIFVGARYRITESFAAFLELDPTPAGIQLGANMRLRYEKMDRKKKSNPHHYKK